jgi:hypothetical protein
VDSAALAKFVRTLGETTGRRAVVGLLRGLAIRFAALPFVFPAAARKHKCKPCQRKKRGKCRGRKPDGTPCGRDRECCDGACKSRCAVNELRDPVTCDCCARGGEPCPTAGPVGCCAKMCIGDVGGGLDICADEAR